jgi:SMI1/KNR4 family protein SUKH-1
MSEAEIAQVENDQRISLPESYRQFLACCGNMRGGPLDSEDVFFKDLLGMKDDAILILREGGDGDQSLDEYVVFMMHQGYIFFCMKNDSTDPLVFGYSSVEGGGMKSEGARFSEFITTALSEGL